VNALQLRNLLIQIGQELHCPACNMKLSSAHLRVEGTFEEECGITISCPSCREEFKGMAHMVSLLTPQGKKLNASSVLTRDQEVGKGVEKIEISSIHDMLTTSFSFSTLFKEEERKS